MTPRPNVIILTSGIAGSSVLASLIARRGYWLGERTETVAYETAENSRLVELNIRLFQASGARGRDLGQLPPPDAARISRLADEIDLTDFREFVAECDANGPWLWKDPRLCYTVGFWQRIMDLRGTRLILASRDHRQVWIGAVLRGRQCVRFADTRDMAIYAGDASRAFIRAIGAEYHEVTFEDLIEHPDRAVAGLNAFLDIDLTVEDVRAVYRGALFRRRWSGVDLVKAWLRYLYCSRVRGARVDPYTDPLTPPT